MANIDVYLAQILAATYGEEVRGSIHDSIQEINLESVAAKEAAEGYRDSAKYYAEIAESWSEHPPYIGANGNWWVWSIPQNEFVDSGVDASITVRIADITMLPADQDPSVTNTGTNTDPIFHLFIPRGLTGNGISGIAKTGTSGLTDIYTITYTDGNTETFSLTNGKGISSIVKTDTTVLTDTYTITYNDGSTFTFEVRNGNGVASIVKTGTEGLTDTYTISYTDENTATFTVTNGRGISSIILYDTSGLTDTYRISFNDGTHFDFEVTNGKSVTTVNRVSRVGLVDTYRMSFNDGTYFDYQVTNGADGAGSVSTVNNVQPIAGNVQLTPEDIGVKVNNVSPVNGNIQLTPEDIGVKVNNVSPEDGNIELTPEDIGITEETVSLTLLAANWDNNKKYSLEATYPSTDYSLKVYLDAATATEDQRKDFYKIRGGYYSTNELVCEKEVPVVNIPVILIVRSKL